MSMKRTISGKVFIENLQIAKKLIQEYSKIRIENRFFIEDASYLEQSQLPVIEERYRQLYQEEIQRQEAEKKRIEEEKRRLEEERKRLEEERRVFTNQQEFFRQLQEIEIKQRKNRSEEKENASAIQKRLEIENSLMDAKEHYRKERENQVVANALKNGYTVKKRILENNKVKLILQRRD